MCRRSSCEHSSSSHVTLCGCQPVKCSMETVVSGPVAPRRCPGWCPCMGCQMYRQKNVPSRPVYATPHLYITVLLFLTPVMLQNVNILVFVFQVSYIYSLAVFEDYLHALHSDPSKESSSVELIQIHRFNITAESRTQASLGNSRALHVYHKLTQPKGKGHFLYK